MEAAAEPVVGDAEVASRRPGRPRSVEADRAIVGAALELIIELGYERLSMEAIRERSGVGKATIYRRWSSKQELIKHAISRLSDDIEIPDTGNVVDDFAQFFKTVARSVEQTGTIRLMPRLMAESAHDPEFHEIVRETLVDPRRAMIRAVLARGLERGELRADLPLETAVDLVHGSIVIRLILQGNQRGIVEHGNRVIATLIRGIAG